MLEECESQWVLGSIGAEREVKRKGKKSFWREVFLLVQRDWLVPTPAQNSVIRHISVFFYRGFFFFFFFFLTPPSVLTIYRQGSINYDNKSITSNVPTQLRHGWKDTDRCRLNLQHWLSFYLIAGHQFVVWSHQTRNYEIACYWGVSTAPARESAPF